MAGVGQNGRHDRANGRKINVDGAQGVDHRRGEGLEWQGRDTVKAESGILGIMEASAQGRGQG